MIITDLYSALDTEALLSMHISKVRYVCAKSMLILDE